MYYLMNGMKFLYRAKSEIKYGILQKTSDQDEILVGHKKRRRTVETSEKTVRRRERYTRRDAT